ncbi:MAG: hypothetical protein ACQESP_03945 [Candidatus Muiribacteriota bacterium]
MKKNSTIYFLIFTFTALLMLVACNTKPSSVKYTEPLPVGDPPQISNIRVKGNESDIEILYNLQYSIDSLFNINVAYVKDTAENFITTANVSGETTQVKPGNDKKIIWHSSLDITSEAMITVELTAEDGDISGAPVETEKFKVDNTGRRVLTDIVLSTQKVNVQVNEELDLSNIEVRARYHNFTEIIVDNVEYEIVSGDGEVENNIFKAPHKHSDVKLKITYPENGVEAEAFLNINVYNTLTGIRLEPEKAEHVGGYFDLSEVKVIATYNDDTERQVLPTEWLVREGGGIVNEFNNNFVYFRDEGVSSDAVLRCIYTENDVTYTEDFVVELTGEETIIAYIERIYGSNSDISIDYKIVNPFGTTDRINFYYSTNGGLSYSRSNNISGQIEALDASMQRITWHSDIDVSGNKNNVVLKIIPVMGSHQGEGIVSQTITVDNNLRTLDYITISEDILNLNKNKEYNLNNIQVEAVYEDAPPRTVDNVKWVKKSGVGEITDNVFNADTTGDALLEVRYTEAGRGSSSTISVTVGRKLIDLRLDKAEADIFLSDTINLRDIKVTAEYEEEPVYKSVNPVWTVKSGPGIINDLYYEGIMGGTAVLEAQYKEGTITQRETLTVNINKQVSKITFKEPEISITVGEDYYLINNDVIINYIDGSTKVAPEVSWSHQSGPGTLDGNIFTAHNTSGTVVLRAQVEDGGNYYTGDFIINVTPVPASLFIDKNKLELFVEQEYNLNSIDVFVKYDDGSLVNIEPHEWEIKSGNGNINGSLFTAPDTADIAVVTAFYTTYTGLGEKTVEDDLIIETKPALTNLTSSQLEYSVDVGNTLDLSNFVYEAHYEDASKREVSSLEYKINSGSGELTGSIFTAPSSAGETNIEIIYKEGTQEQSTIIKLNNLAELDYITINPDKEYMEKGDSFNLSNIQVQAHYRGGPSRIVEDVNWVEKTNLGNISDNRFYAENTGNAELEVEYVHQNAEGDLISKKGQLQIEITPEIIEIILNPTGKTLAAGTDYDLRNVSVNAHYSDGSSYVASENISWDISSGEGSIANKIYSSQGEGQDILLCKYRGVSKEFKININKKLENIFLDKEELVLLTGESLNLSDNVQVMGEYNDGSQKNITEEIQWDKTSGVGTLSGTSFNAPAALDEGQTQNQAILRATYEESEIEENTSLQIIIIPELHSISLNPSEVTHQLPDSFDLINIEVLANYVNNASKSILHENIDWSFLRSDSGEGRVASEGDEYIYVPEVDYDDTAEVRVSYTDIKEQNAEETLILLIE